MDRLISEQEVINILMDNNLDHIQIEDGTELIQLIKAIPSAQDDYVMVKRKTWEDIQKALGSVSARGC